MIMISLMLPEKMLERIRKISKDTGLPVSEHIRRAIDIYLYMEQGDRMAFLLKASGIDGEYVYPPNEQAER